MRNRKNYVAVWDGGQLAYLCRELEIWSADGDTWHDDYGGHANGEDFNHAAIALQGGPRDGETVA